MLGMLLKELREGKYSQRELAQHLGISHSYISKIENSETINVSDDLLEKIAEVLSCEPEILYLAAHKIYPPWLQLDINSKSISVYDTLKSKIARGFSHHDTTIPEVHLLAAALIQSPLGYAIINMHTMTCLHVSRSFKAQMDDALEAFNLFELIPDLEFILRRYYGQKIHQQCLLPILHNHKYHFIDFFLRTFEVKKTPFALLEFIDGQTQPENHKGLLGTSFCFEKFFVNASYGILATQQNPVTNKQTLLNCNDAFCELLGYSKKELLLGVSYFENLEYRTDASRHRATLLNAHKSLHFTIVLIKKGGTKLPLEANVHLYEDEFHQGLIYIFKPFMDT